MYATFKNKYDEKEKGDILWKTKLYLSKEIFITVE